MADIDHKASDAKPAKEEAPAANLLRDAQKETAAPPDKPEPVGDQHRDTTGSPSAKLYESISRKDQEEVNRKTWETQKPAGAAAEMLALNPLQGLNLSSSSLLGDSNNGKLPTFADKSLSLFPDRNNVLSKDYIDLGKPVASGPKPEEAPAAGFLSGLWNNTGEWLGKNLKDAGGWLWDKGEALIDKTWDFVTSDGTFKDNIKVTKDAAGKTQEVMVSMDQATRQLTADETRYKDKTGAWIIENKKTGEITSESADGKTVYQKLDDGREIVRDADGQTIRDKKTNTYTRIDKDGTTTTLDHLDPRNPKELAAITHFDAGFNFVQLNRKLSVEDADNSELFRRIHDKTPGDTSVIGQNGVMHDFDGVLVHVNDHEHGTFIRARDHEGVFRVKDGVLLHRTGEHQWGAVADNDPAILSGLVKKTENGWQIDGVDVNRDGSVKTRTGQEIKETGDKVEIKGVDHEGRPVIGTVDTGTGESKVTDGKGATTDLNPADPEHLIRRTNPGGDEVFNFNDKKQEFSTDRVTFTPDSTRLDYADWEVDPDGSVTNSDGSYIFDSRSDSYEQASQMASSASQDASSVCAAVAGEVSAGTCDAGDVATVLNALGDLSGALNAALSSGNLEAAAQIASARSMLESLLGQVQSRADVTQRLQSAGISDQTAMQDAQRQIPYLSQADIVELERQKREKGQI